MYHLRQGDFEQIIGAHNSTNILGVLRVVTLLVRYLNDAIRAFGDVQRICDYARVILVLHVHLHSIGLLQNELLVGLDEHLGVEAVVDELLESIHARLPLPLRQLKVLNTALICWK